MCSPTHEIVHFVTGLRYHDVCKPFYHRGKYHTRIGFIFLSALGMEEEVQVVLAHHNFLNNLALYFKLSQNAGQTLPSCLLLAGPLDQLAASTYAFLEKELTKYPPYNNRDFPPPYSYQNPFTRLPAIATSTGEKWYGQWPIDQCKFWDDFVYGLIPPPGTTWANVKNQLDNIGNATPNGINALIKQLKSCDLTRFKEKLLLDDYAPTKMFPERTYPPVNDTSLDEHQKLTAALGLVVYVNLFKAEVPFLKKKITCDSSGNLYLDSDQIKLKNDKLDTWNCEIMKKVRELVRSHSECVLLRVSFTGLSDALQKAVRLDDFYGVQRLIGGYKSFKGLRHVFMQQFAEKVSEKIKLPLIDILKPLNEFPFDLIYLLPDLIYLLPDCLSETDIQVSVKEAFKKACEKIASELLPRIVKDFKGTSLNFEEQRELEALITQLQTLPIGLKMVRFCGDTTLTNFNEFKKDFSRKLHEGYRNVSPPQGPEDLIVDETLLKSDEDIEALCDVCQLHPVYKPLYETLENPKIAEKEKEILKKVTYEFRGEPDRVCLLCLANRVLSHGTLVAEEKAPWLDKQIEIIDGQVKIINKKGLPQLPAFARTFNWEDADNTGSIYLDLGVAFVRLYKEHGIIKHSVFPTIECVADSDSNVALIEIVPNELSGIFEEYNFYKESSDVLVFQKAEEYVQQAKNLDQTLSTALSILNELLSKQIDKGTGIALNKTLRGRNLGNLPLNDAKNILKDLLKCEPIKELQSIYRRWLSRPEDARRLITKEIQKPERYPQFPSLEELYQLQEVNVQNMTDNDRGHYQNMIDDIRKINRQAEFLKKQIKNIRELILQRLQGKYIEKYICEMNRTCSSFDLKHYFEFYLMVCATMKGSWAVESQKVFDEIANVKPHLARVLTRIKWISQFYQKIPDVLTGKGIRNLPLEIRYPRFMLLVPASDVVKTLNILHRELAEFLFSSEMYQSNGLEVEKLSLELLDCILPPLLFSSVMIFKKKQALYNVMTASEKMITKLRDIGSSTWNGILFGFSDYRGILADESPIVARGDFSSLYTTLKVCKSVDYRSIETAILQSDRQGIPGLRTALLKIRAKRKAWKPEILQALEPKEMSEWVFYLKNFDS